MVQKPKNSGNIDEQSGETEAVHMLKVTGVLVLEFIKVAVLAVITVWVVRYFIFKPFIVHGASMAPNFLENEYLIIDELSFRFTQPRRGQILVVRNPHRTGEYFLKRLIGLPGERIVVREGKVLVYPSVEGTGAILTEPYLPQREFTPGDTDVILGENEYYVMGDNRDASYDSRMFGPLVSEAIVGKVLLRGWPFDRVQRFALPDYNL